MKQGRTFKQVAEDIKSVWTNVYPGAVPYLEALLTLDTTNPSAPYRSLTARDIAKYFLANARSLMGERANRLKQELNFMIYTDSIKELCDEIL